MFGWLREERPREQTVAAGWAGAISLPRLLRLRADGTLTQSPAPELQTLRRAHAGFAAMRLDAAPSDLSRGLPGDRLEIAAVIDPGDAATFGLSVLCAPDGSEETRIVYDREQGTLLLDRTRASLAVAPERPVVGGVCPLDGDGLLRLRIFVDGSIVEVFANDSLCLSGRVYPTLPDSTGVALYSQGGNAVARSLDLWEMAPTW